MKKRIVSVLVLLLAVSLLFTGCSLEDILKLINGEEPAPPSVSLDTIPDFDGSTPYVIINDNVPFFTDEKTDESYESFGALDTLGRCTVAMSCIGIDLMPTEERGDIGHVKPTGWHSVKYDGQYLYNRCHLIGFQLTGENDNEKNLITGTRYMNVDGMLPFENMIADYVEETENHVLYRVTPIFDGYDLVAHGVLMEAKSVEDDGEGILFCVYVYNNQPGIVIDYGTGESRLSGQEEGKGPEKEEETGEVTYILNTSSKRFHKQTCSGVGTMSESNKEESYKTREEIIADGYTPCGSCNP